MRARNKPQEIVLPRVKLWLENEGYIVVLECLCGHAVQYPGHAGDRGLSRCEVCGVQWRTLEPADLLRSIGG